MASLIGWLAYDGVRTSAGAAVASGQAWFFQPGTTATQVTVFSDADGLAAVTQPVALDAAGRATVYTSVPVRIEVEDATGVEVLVTDRSNTIAAAQVEIQNSVATGTDLTTGAQVAGGRTDLDAFLTSIRTSLMAKDGNVLFGAVEKPLWTALRPLDSVYDVRNYGASGGGVVDDAPAIQAAIAAAEAGGGTVFFPPGTYRLLSTLTITGTVQFRGAGEGLSTLAQFGVAAPVLTFNHLGGTEIFSMADLSLTGDDTSNSVLLLVSSAGLSYEAHRCRFRGVTTDVASTEMILKGRWNFTDCDIETGGSLGFRTVTFTSSNTVVAFTGCRIGWSASSAMAHVDNGTMFFVGCNLFRANNGAATVMLTGTGNVGLVGCWILSLGGILNLINGPTVAESGCIFDTGMIGNTSLAYSQSRDGASLRTSTAAITYRPNAAKYMAHEVVSSGATFQWEDPTGAPVASGIALTLILRYKNTSGGAITPTFGAAYKGTAVAVANNSGCGWLFIYDFALSAWTQIGAPAAYPS